MHKKIEQDIKDYDVFNLKKVKDGKYAVSTTFEHAGIFLKEVAGVVESTYQGLANENRQVLKKARGDAKKIQRWANIIVANVFKTLRVLQKEAPAYTQKYAATVNVLQEIAECQRDAIRRAYDHVHNNHKGMLPVQLEELNQIKELVVGLLNKTSDTLREKNIAQFKTIVGEEEKLDNLERHFDKNQVARIQDGISKTRLSILFYGFIRDSRLIVWQTVNMMKIFEESFRLNNRT